MSENRKRYSAAPLYGMKQKHRAPSGGGFQLPEKKENNFSFLQLLLSLLLPALFLLAILLRSFTLHWVFIAFSAASLLIMWLTGAFISGARTKLTLIYLTLIAVSLFAINLLSGGNAGKSSGSTPAPTPTPTLAGSTVLSSGDASGSLVDLTADLSQTAAAQFTSDPNAVTKAQAQLELFMSCWMNIDYSGMISYCLPSWVSNQKDAEKSIFQIRANRTPLDYTVESVSGTESDDSRTVTMIASIDKNNGKDPLNYRFQVLMLKVNDTWYVDPLSFNSSDIVEAAEKVNVQITLAPTVTPDPNIVLYYNPDGGSYYHTDPDCTSIGAKYRPLTASFRYSQLDEETYKNLKPCSECNAPAR